MASPLDSTYGVWLVSLFLETLLYGMGVLQTWIYFAARPNRHALCQVDGSRRLSSGDDPNRCSSFFRRTLVSSSASGSSKLILSGPIRCNSLPPIFPLSLFRYILRPESINSPKRGRNSASPLSAYTQSYVLCADLFLYRAYFFLRRQLLLAVVQIVAGIIQTIWSYELRSFLKLDETKAITTLQAAASLACDPPHHHLSLPIPQHSEGRDDENQHDDGHAYSRRYQSRRADRAVFRCEHGFVSGAP
ncbi:hypothetical protein B0H14DRAFT_3907896 [Mycena olivaceomarginata]|nr:hypothetical protein B0H14DRAFT_3907896 [Mycena olivaceomarginata]